MDKDLPIFGIKTLEEYVANSVATSRFNSTLLAIFASVALVLTIVGLYGVMSYSVAQRTREIGIRMALGANRGRMLTMILRQGMTLTLTGVALGLVGAYVLTRYLGTLNSMLFGVQPRDPLTFVATAVLLTVVALVACFIPARRATKVDPMVALSYE